jgi:His/Glu/Gln/Arg/opine family amino acid ABC transporter permease subunit
MVFMDEGLIAESGRRGFLDRCENPRTKQFIAAVLKVNLLAKYAWSLVWEHRSELLHGMLTALEVAAVALVISTAVGLLLALARMGKPPLSWLAVIYINVFRGVPALVSVIWVYFGLSLIIGISFSVFQAGVIALVLLYSAFIAEIYRSALGAIPRGQREAGLALGIHPVRVFARVVLPQATKIAIPNIGSMFIGMVKDTSTFTVIGLLEVVRVTQNLNSTTFQPFVLYTAAAALYVVAAFGIDLLFRTIEKLLATPPSGRVARAFSRRRRKRLEAVMLRLESASGRT